MAIEIERKFLVLGKPWLPSQGTPFVQGYLNRDKARTVRVRIAGSQAFLTVKGPTTGMARPEFEYPIPVADAEELLKLSDGPVLEKRRHLVPYAGMTWEIDEFQGENAGLVVAEIELADENQSFERPPWLAREVTGDPRYYNANLTVSPYSTWRDSTAG